MVGSETVEGDNRNRAYLSAIEAAIYLGVTVSTVHAYVKTGVLNANIAASGQQRFDFGEVKTLKSNAPSGIPQKKPSLAAENFIDCNGTVQKVYVKNAQQMDDIPDCSIHLMVTSPPYFDTKMYSGEPIEHDLGNLHDLDEWFEEITKVWAEVYRTLQPGRKAFINIMNPPIREKNSFRSLNLAGRTVDVCERVGFVFKRDIVWHKTNGVRAHFGTYPYPGGILINNMHEFILEFEKPAPSGYKKYQHLTQEQKDQSKLTKEFWLSIKNSDVWLMRPQGSSDNRNHVAPFPRELPRRLITAYSYVGETVLDPFLGSAVTLSVASNLGRHGVGYEINPQIAEEAVNTLRTFQRNMNLASEGPTHQRSSGTKGG